MSERQLSPPTVRRVLIADDAADLRQLVRVLLEASGHFIVVGEASDGAQAVEFAARHRPDLVLLDLSMPVMDGLQALPAILTSSPKTMVVALSGFEASRMAAAALQQGAVAYLDKDGLSSRLVQELVPLVDTDPPSRSHPGIRRTVETRGTDSGVHDSPLNPDYLFETFVPGSSNRFAHAAALSVAESPGKSYNPLFVYGTTGLGKTHLLHAIGHYTRQHHPDRRARYVSTDTFTNELIHAIRTNTTIALNRRYRECDVLLVDDVQFLEGKERTQEEFFHTFNALHGAGHQIVLTSDRSPRAIPTLGDRLCSRFEWGLITDVQPPDIETRIAILQRKADAEGSRLPDEVLEFICTRITDNVRELEGAVTRVVAYASLNREPLTQALAERVLSNLPSRPRSVTSPMILDATAEMLGFSIDELCGTSRVPEVVIARQISMYVHRELTDLSYPAIARSFGGRDHTTVMHAVRKISALMKEHRPISDPVFELIHRIKSGG